MAAIPTIPQVQTALATQIDVQIPGLRALDHVPSQINPPTAIVRPSRATVIDYLQTFDGAQNLYFEIVVLAAAGRDETAQTVLNGYLSQSGANSVLLAVQADPTLGGVVSNAVVVQAKGYGEIAWAGQEYLASTLIVQVMAP